MSRLDELTAVLTQKQVFIQMHNYPDQDALASACGLQRLLLTKGISSVICYKGRIDKYNMIRAIELLGIDIFPIEEIDMQPSDEIILVDCQKGNTNVKDFIGNEVGCIDHHTLQAADCYRFHDIRSHVGACSTIIAAYFPENGLEPDRQTATALAYGIKIDTASLSRGISDLDIDMFCYLLKRSDLDILRRLEGCNLKMQDLEAYREAINDLRIYGRVGLAGIGPDCSEALIGTIADFLLSLEEVGFTLVHSYRNGGLKFSVRSESEDMNAAAVIKEILRGCGDGGGHNIMAAGFIPDVSPKQALPLVQMVEDRLIELLA